MPDIVKDTKTLASDQANATKAAIVELTVQQLDEVSGARGVWDDLIDCFRGLIKRR